LRQSKEENEHLKQLIDKREDYEEVKRLTQKIDKLNEELSKVRTSELQLKLRVNELLSGKGNLMRRSIQNSRENGQGCQAEIINARSQHR